MNWYKAALTQKEFYEFYAIQGLQNETLKDHPEVWFRLIESINNIRVYYLSFLMKDGASELDHFAYANKDNNIQEGHDIFNIIDVLSTKLKSCFDNPDQCNWTGTEKQMIMSIFYDYKWSKPYGGKAWGDIFKWMWKLYEAGPIEQIPYNEALLYKVRGLVVAIDTIHSLEHNTGAALRDLPEGEHVWMPYALDRAWQVEHPVVLSDLAQNHEISELYRREELPLTHDRHYTDKKTRVINDFAKLTYEQQEDLLRTSRDLDLINMIIRVGNPKAVMMLCRNPYVASHLNIVKKIYDRLSAIENLWDITFIAESHLITDDVVNFLMNIEVGFGVKRLILKYLFHNLYISDAIKAELEE